MLVLATSKPWKWAWLVVELVSPVLHWDHPLKQEAGSDLFWEYWGCVQLSLENGEESNQLSHMKGQHSRDRGSSPPEVAGWKWDQLSDAQAMRASSPMAPRGNVGHEHQHRLCGRTMDPARHNPQPQFTPGCHRDLDVSTSHSDRYGSCKSAWTPLWPKWRPRSQASAYDPWLKLLSRHPCGSGWQCRTTGCQMSLCCLFISVVLKRQVYSNVRSKLPLPQCIILMKIDNQFHLVTHTTSFHMLKEMLIVSNYVGSQLPLWVLKLAYHLQIYLKWKGNWLKIWTHTSITWCN